MPQPAPERRHVFISYSHADRIWVERLQRMMAPLLRDTGQELRLWDDSQIEAGLPWRPAIEAALAEAKVALLLVSDAFLASEFVINEELPVLLAAAKAEGLLVLWVSVSPCLVEHTPIYAYQAVLSPSRHLNAMNAVELAEALKTIARAILKALAALLPKATPSPAPASASPAPAVTPQILRWSRTTEVYWEKLDGLALPLLRIPAGRFLMGSPPTEPERSREEGPQREVTLNDFLIGRTPITQAQWRVVAAWQERSGESWDRELKPNPSWFQGMAQGEGTASLFADERNTDNRPVERVSWHDAMEFCNRLNQRLGQRSGRHYTLPSEAQWEYACRAGTTTPFAFGETITPELANYDGNYSYANGPKGIDREQTTPVGMFPANAWGLQDMHGNVWEWCLDHWHRSYAGAPADGTAWVNGGDQREGSGRQADPQQAQAKSGDDARRLLRGGSWDLRPWYCRSAFRFHLHPDYRDDGLGFRVCCLPQGRFLNP